MGELLPLPRAGDVFADVRSRDRTMRVSWHAEAGEAGQVVVSLWAGRECRASFRLPAADVPRLIETLTEALPTRGSASTPAARPTRATASTADTAPPDAPVSPAA
jgi:hypothetical protein